MNVIRSKGQLSKVLGLLIDTATEKALNKELKVLNFVGFADKKISREDIEAEQILINGISNVLIKISKFNSIKRADVAVFYGLSKAKDFGLISEKIEVMEETKKFQKALTRKTDFAGMHSELSRLLKSYNFFGIR